MVAILAPREGRDSLPAGVRESREGERVYLRFEHRKGRGVCYYPCGGRWVAEGSEGKRADLPTEALARMWAEARLEELAGLAGRPIPCALYGALWAAFLVALLATLADLFGHYVGFDADTSPVAGVALLVMLAGGLFVFRYWRQ